MYTYITSFYLFPICISQFRKTKKKQHLNLITVSKIVLLIMLIVIYYSCTHIHNFVYLFPISISQFGELKKAIKSYFCC